MSALLAFEEAQSRVIALAVARGSERVSVREAAGRVLAADLVSDRDLPPFDYSSMDGYAVAASSLDGYGPHRLPVAGETRAGDTAQPLTPGTARRIFTGAPMPPGADAVVMQEAVVRHGAVAVFASAPDASPTARGAFVRRKGDDLPMGAVAIARGTRLRPSHLALAATLDRPWLAVARRPVVTLLATGSELRAPGEPARPGSIPESNAFALAAMAERAGATVRVAPDVGDLRADLERAITDGLRGTDVLVTIGGASVGDHDLVKPCLEACGVALDFWKVAMKPGKPLMVGRATGGRGELVLGLPGNPVSALVTFALFGVPLLRALQGDVVATGADPSRRRARLAVPVRRTAGRTEFLRATLSRAEDGTAFVTPLPNQASGAVTALAQAHALVQIPASCDGLAAGDVVEYMPLEDLGL